MLKSKQYRFPRPVCKTKVKSFIGLTGVEECELASQDLTLALCSVRVPVFSRMLNLQTDIYFRNRCWGSFESA